MAKVTGGFLELVVVNALKRRQQGDDVVRRVAA
jgi:hypothetical protein